MVNEMKIHHIGYLVKNIEMGIALFREMEYDLEKDIIFDEFRDVDICFLKKDGYRVELVSPRSKHSVVGELRKKIGNSPYHICYEVEDIEESIADFEKKKFVIWEEPHKAPAIDGNRVAFMMNAYIGMVELLENKTVMNGEENEKN